MTDLILLEKITRKIFIIRGHKVMLDRDLAEHDDQFRVVFEAIKQLIKEDEKPKKRIGFYIFNLKVLTRNAINIDTFEIGKFSWQLRQRTPCN
jgi:hypothetical protein